MLIKTVTTVTALNSAGQIVEALPVRQAVAGETDIVGRPVTPVSVTEDVRGVPVRFVTGNSAVNSAGQVVDTIPVAGGTPVAPPVNSVAPSISGTPTSGQTLTANDGTWSDSPTFTRQWKADGAAISGQTGSTLLLDDSYVGKSITVTVTATNTGGSVSATSAAVGPVASLIPFTYDANTYWWDFAAADNEVDNSGVATVSRIHERVGNKATIRNYNKAWQPLKVAGGITFNQTTNRFLTFSLPPLITNAKNGWYIAFPITPTTATNGVVMSISSAGSTVNSRMYVDFTGSRNIRLRFGAGDSSTLATLFTSAALTLGQKYAIEILLDFDADTYTLWINGVNQNVTIVGGPWSNFPASNPREVLIGNFTSGNLSLDAVLNNIVFQDGVPSSDIRSSVGAFQQTRQAA